MVKNKTGKIKVKITNQIVLQKLLDTIYPLIFQAAKVDNGTRIRYPITTDRKL